MNRSPLVLLLAGAFLVRSLPAEGANTQSGFYIQNNLVSDQTGVATHQDTALIDAWGLAFVSGGPWWVNANATGLSRLYNGQGVIQPLDKRERCNRSHRIGDGDGLAHRNRR
jgi:hypothetical protein